MRTQRKLVLELLIEANKDGVNSYDLTYKYGIKQAPTRVKELKRLGHDIVSVRQKNRSVTYILNKDQRHEREGIDYKWDFENGIARKVYL